MSARVTPGMSPTRVLALLDSMQVAHYPYDRATRTIVAKWVDKSRWQLVTRTVVFKFKFDSTDVLASHVVSEYLTGP